MFPMMTHASHVFVGTTKSFDIAVALLCMKLLQLRFNRAVTLNPRLGDVAWLHFCKLQRPKIHGTMGGLSILGHSLKGKNSCVVVVHFQETGPLAIQN